MLLKPKQKEASFISLDEPFQSRRKDSITAIALLNSLVDKELSQIITISKDFQSTGSWAWIELYNDGNYQILEVWTKDESCQEMSCHSHIQHEVFILLEGSVEIRSQVGSRTTSDLLDRPFSSCWVEAGITHSVIPSSQARLLIICVPPIPEFKGAGDCSGT
jgi:mannose-6-phosphate isomerase-like protein (cupin superfamily)